MYQTIQVSSCVSAQGDLVEQLPNGDVVIRDGGHTYRGRPIAPIAAATAVRTPRPAKLTRDDACRAAQSQPASSRSRIATIISMCAGSAFRQGM